MEHKCDRHPERAASYRCAKFNSNLCDDCIQCLDPGGFCRHRSSCLIWELARHGMPGNDQDQEDRPDQVPVLEKEELFGVSLMPGGQQVDVPSGTTLLEAAQEAGHYVNARCGGKGVCGTCKVKVLQGEVRGEDSILLRDKDRSDDMVLACTSKVVGPVSILLPDSNEARALKIVEEGQALTQKLPERMELSPMAALVPLELDPPSLDNPVSDLERIKTALHAVRPDLEPVEVGLPLLRKLGDSLRSLHWRVNVVLVRRGSVWEMVEIGEFDSEQKIYGLAVDLGTTSVVVSVLDLSSGQVLAVTSTQNEQAVCGEDLISRIICATGKGGLEKLHRYAARTINQLIAELLAVTSLDGQKVFSIALAGNTVMTQSILKLDPGSIRSEPYIPLATRFPPVRAGEIGLDVHPGAQVFVVPGNAAYVGGDITAGIVSSEMHREDELSLFVDVGTNGEMVLGNKDFMLTAACSAGPAFEGGGIRHGMRALPGAIDQVEIDGASGELKISTVDDLPARGICGSGMISLIGSLYKAGIIDTSGRFFLERGDQRVRSGEFGPEYVLAWAEQSGLDEDVILSEVDISTLIRSKAAVYGGLKTLLGQAGLTMDALSRIRIAGGFGKYIDFEMAVVLGLLPDVERSKYSYLGNSSLSGATMALLSQQARDEMDQVSQAMTYVDFSASNQFFDEYQQAMFLPHTEARDFPSVQVTPLSATAHGVGESVLVNDGQVRSDQSQVRG